MMPMGFSTMTSPTSVRSADGAISIEDFWAFPPAHNYIYMPCREPWPAESVNSILPPVRLYSATGQPLKVNGKLVKLKPAAWLDQHRRAEQLTWAPGFPEIVANKHIVDGGWFDRPGGHCLNLYRPPRIMHGDAGKAGPWIDHLKKIYDDDSRHIVAWLAHRVQRPGEKINHALVLGGSQGIGKDSLLEPIKQAVGPWNFHDISPKHLLETFNPFVRSVILRISESHDLGEDERINRFAFYEHIKIYAAAPPDVLRCNEKYLRQHYVFNTLGLILTTNHKSDGLYLPPDDRRHYVAWSNHRKEAFTKSYWNTLWGWYENEDGCGHVAAYLAQFDLCGFDPKAPPVQTAAFWDICSANLAPEDTELGDVIASLGYPNAFILADLITSPAGASLEWLIERKSRRAVPHRLERCGYVSCRNPNSNDGRWKITDRNQTVYVKASLSLQEQFRAAAMRRDRG
jgi:hypothetical protein